MARSRDAGTTVWVVLPEKLTSQGLEKMKRMKLESEDSVVSSVSCGLTHIPPLTDDKTRRKDWTPMYCPGTMNRHMEEKSTDDASVVHKGEFCSTLRKGQSISEE